ncbi:Uncharacterised protein [Klebsiella pneumoniae]|uniref:Uncharacterized protein n=1 Tax=Klebsiella pneumoniae TaxID=573 RepID=A0A2X3GVV4_KLEPN|nr:Uncharacterised protein [Klebsiella pneumoniae]
MHEGVILPAVGHLPGIQPVGAAADPADRKDAGGGQRLVDFGEQPMQIGLLADVVGTFGDKMRMGPPYACAGNGNTALTWPVPELGIAR